MDGESGRGDVAGLSAPSVEGRDGLCARFETSGGVDGEWIMRSGDGGVFSASFGLESGIMILGMVGRLMEWRDRRDLLDVVEAVC